MKRRVVAEDAKLWLDPVDLGDQLFEGSVVEVVVGNEVAFETFNSRYCCVQVDRLLPDLVCSHL